MAARDLHGKEQPVTGVPRNERGYTLAETLTVLAIFAIVLTVTTVTFNRIVSNSARLIKSEQTEIEGMIGLEVLRIDLENAGVGLPWSYRSAGWSGYPGAESGTTAALFNEAQDPASGEFEAPRGLMVASGIGINGSDYLVLKGAALGVTRSARKWSYLTFGNSTAVMKPSRGENELVAGEEPNGSTRSNGGPWVIILKDTVREGMVGKELVMDGSGFVTRFNGSLPAAMLPQAAQDRYVVYGVHDDSDDDKKPVRPYNRVDYYLKIPDDLPGRCAPGTGTLYKEVLDVDKGTFGTSYPLLDCVADLKVVVGLDSNYDGEIDSWIKDLGGYDAQAIREQVKEVRVYILAQEGARDVSYLYPVVNDAEAVVLGSRQLTSERAGVWSSTRMSATFGAGWRHYRWKVYRIVVQPKNLQ